jgi:thiol:disulfide interchange protein DsbD
VAAWVTSEDAAFRRARVEHRPLLIHFHAAWCAACGELDRQTYANPRVREATKAFVALRLDATNEDAPEVQRWGTKYRLVGLPTVIILDAQGEEQARFTEFVPPEKLLEALARVR